MTFNRIGVTAQSTQIRDLIADMPFWKNVPPNEVVDLVVNETRRVDYSVGQVITRQDDKCENVFYWICIWCFYIRVCYLFDDKTIFF